MDEDEVQQSWPSSGEGSSDYSSPDWSPYWTSKEESVEDAFSPNDHGDDGSGNTDADAKEEGTDDDDEPPANGRGIIQRLSTLNLLGLIV